MTRNRLLACRPILVLLLVAACAGQGAAPSPTASGNAFDPQGAWQLARGTVDGAAVPIVDGHPITLTIDGTQVAGTAACNHYGGQLVVAGDGLTIDELGMTAMGCEQDVLTSESAFTDGLARVDAIDREEGALVLTGPGVELRFEALPPPPTAELVDTAWVLDTLFVGDVASSPEGEPAMLELRSDGTFSGSTGCRTFSGQWLEQGEQIIAPTFGMAQTECPEALLQQDSHVVAVIGDGFVPTVEGDLLTLTDPGGVGLVYRAAE